MEEIKQRVWRKAIVVLIFLSIAGATVPIATADTLTWSKTTVDSTGIVGWFTSIALDSSNHPHISYYDIDNGDLKYAYDGNGDGDFEDVGEIQTVDSTGDVGRYTFIALDSSNHPHISYYDDTNDDLKYVYDSDGDGDLTDETPQTVDSTGTVGWYTSIALDSSDHPHISYFDYTNDDLKYVYDSDGDGDLTDEAPQTVDSTGSVGWYTSIALDSSNNPHISYYDDTNDDLKYVYDSDGDGDLTDETPQTVDSTGDVGYYTSIALDSSNNPHISYYDETNYDLKYAYDGNGDRDFEDDGEIQTVDSTGYVGYHTSIALDSLGYIHISYYDYTNYDLKYAKSDQAPVPPIPELSTIILMGIGLLTLVGYVGYRQKKSRRR